MGQITGIQWCHHTFNGWIGCAKVSDGCKHCYAEALMDHRHHKAKWGVDGTRTITSDANWKLPERWDLAAANAGEWRRVFCSSLADVFEDREDLDAPRARLFELIQWTPNLDWLLLTKRPENWHALMVRARRYYVCEGFCYDWLDGDAPANVWMGVSVENQACANERIPNLLEIPASVRFLSVEPLLEPIDLKQLNLNSHEHLDALNGERSNSSSQSHGPHVDWIIIGGESGRGARPCDLAWIRSLRDQCRDTGVACFIKQLGANAFDNAKPIRLRDSHGGDPTEWPEDLRVRELPRVVTSTGAKQ